MERLWNAYGTHAKTEFLLCWEHMEHMEHLILNKLHGAESDVGNNGGD